MFIFCVHIPAISNVQLRESTLANNVLQDFATAIPKTKNILCFYIALLMLFFPSLPDAVITVFLHSGTMEKQQDFKVMSNRFAETIFVKFFFTFSVTHTHTHIRLEKSDLCKEALTETGGELLKHFSLSFFSN